ncbi:MULTISPECIES: adenosylcobinamide-GDP ribazoletransferase [Carboxydocella]|uniref:Adenosylcobinamide-GDP ribazoletransferase n=2 Tax=Carboxydocella TaxID=178898 RepID=A0A1T4LRM2_9FIRM|nr:MULTISPECIES: adenosylcobinamide-GDP ribazoletransferase [Carboxydocella]AVX20569.1 cobalamin-5'-phosphate synthase [Carboxydocella thermautotrophica]AVX30991.1 cobalamin-5'-phosphate synthase [Carboxydocella thermautotrophica]SJZ57104.1 cobalamin-5'-phosphate synthase [Carboxydocella sporoproducens DSM 16521]GAW29613.1 hypothetical protein ULO1_21830 [Carboxydocella sp. ULO1]GAW31496.1 hypothetical protein JDF658_12610 [Carboxydocella sp. JDF658]
MKSAIFALHALTRISLFEVKWDEKAFGKATAYFPVIGLLLGGIYLLIAVFLAPFASSVILAALLIWAHTILTGAMHIDGLLDTIDAVFSNRSPERMLEIMKDSHVGSNAVIGAFCLYLLKYSFLIEIIKNKQLVLIVLAPVLARFNQVVVIYFFPYIRPQGLGSLFKNYTGKKEFMLASFFTILSLIIMSYWLEFADIFLFLISIITALLWGKKFTKLFGGLTGDLYGALNEITEILILVAGYFLLK